MPRKDLASPATAPIKLRQNLSEGEHGIVTLQRHGTDLLGCRNAAMVCVVKQQSEAPALLALAADRRHQIRVGPLVHHHHIRPLEQQIEVRRVAIEVDRELRKGLLEGSLRTRSLIRQKARAAPAICGLPGLAAMSPRDQLSQNAALEMGVSMIPVGDKGVREENEMHAVAPAPCPLADHTTNPRFSSSCWASLTRSRACCVDTH